MHHNNWPSDITAWINNVEIDTWTSPADFGGTRGLLTPTWWETKDTQYGVLKIWSVQEEGSFIGGRAISSVRVDDLCIPAHPFIEVRLNVKPDANNVGELNLFGDKFGNYPQPLVMKVNYEQGEKR